MDPFTATFLSQVGQADINWDLVEQFNPDGSLLAFVAMLPEP